MTFTVHKRDHHGATILTYTGDLVQREEDFVCVRAIFAFDKQTNYVHFKQGDIFTEWFYSNRWYNVFQIEDVDSGDLKGYYCNFTRPADITSDAVAADDLALDAFVALDGNILMLDEDEYADLPLSDEERQSVAAALADLKQRVANRQSPFHTLPV